MKLYQRFIIETEKPLPDVAPPVTNNPAYRLVTVVQSHQKQGNTSDSDKEYGDLEEVFFKHTSNNNPNSYYEPVECHL